MQLAHHYHRWRAAASRRIGQSLRALRHSTGWKAATLSLIAAMPVKAAQPELKARINRRGPDHLSSPEKPDRSRRLGGRP